MSWTRGRLKRQGRELAAVDAIVARRHPSRVVLTGPLELANVVARKDSPSPVAPPAGLAVHVGPCFHLVLLLEDVALRAAISSPSEK